jgi:hypothetical protein
MQSPPFPRYLVPPRSKYSPQHHILKHPQLPFLPQCQRPSILYIATNSNIVVFMTVCIHRYIHTPARFLCTKWDEENTVAVRCDSVCLSRCGCQGFGGMCSVHAASGTFSFPDSLFTVSKKLIPIHSPRSLSYNFIAASNASSSHSAI